jgi:CheY-like chemotaxis protein
MDPEAEASVERLKNDLVKIRQKFAQLALSQGALTDGYRTIAEGLGLVLDELAADATTHQARLEVVLAGLETLADLMDERALPAEIAADGGSESSDPASQFLEMFRTEARKRLSGLSISMMGIFSERASQDALTQTADHLHAMKGAASMVGLPAIADLVSAMEQVVVDMKRQEPEERTWPTRALMRGFHLLEEAARHEALALDEELAGDVVRTLKAYRKGPEVGQAQRSEPQTSGTERGPNETQPLEAAPRRSESNHFDRFADYDGPLEKRILIVDDIETIAASVGFVLSELDVPIDMAEHGEQALEMLKARPYSLVVSDVDMPRMDGVALTRMVQNDERLSQIPVILLTSLDRPDERAAGIEAGATDYIIKGSIGGGELLNRVKELLELAPDVPADDVPSSGEQFRILIAEDVETIAASIAFVLSEGPFEIEIARNGAKALARLQEESYDLLLSDVQMPEMGGLELLSAVRSDDKLNGLPVILLTSLQDPEVQQQALDAGVNRFLIKGEVAGAKLRKIIEETAASDGA